MLTYTKFHKNRTLTGKFAIVSSEIDPILVTRFQSDSETQTRRKKSKKWKEVGDDLGVYIQNLQVSFLKNCFITNIFFNALSKQKF